MTTSARSSSSQLALEGGPAAISDKLPPIYPGGMRIGQEEEDAVVEVIRSRRLFRYYGPESGESKVAELERAVAEKFNARHTLAVSSGTMALAAGLAALGIGPGDEVIVPAYTWIASAAAVLLVGAVPVIAEVDDSLLLDASDAEQRVTSRTRALLPVHMRGAPCNMDALLEVAARHDLAIVEDVAQANGASYNGRCLGTIGNIGGFSLQFNKILTAGEGGLVTTNDENLYQRALLFHDVAASRRANLAEHEVFVGTTCRLSELQAAVALVQLGKLDGLLADMRERHTMISERLSDLAAERGVTWRHQWDPKGDAGVALIAYLPDAERASYAKKALRAEGLPASLLYEPDVVDLHVADYWEPVLAQRSWFKPRGNESSNAQPLKAGSWPRTTSLLGRSLHIDVNPEYTESQMDQVCNALEKVFLSLPQAQ